MYGYKNVIDLILQNHLKVYHGFLCQTQGPIVSVHDLKDPEDEQKSVEIDGEPGSCITYSVQICYP